MHIFTCLTPLCELLSGHRWTLPLMLATFLAFPCNASADTLMEAEKAQYKNCRLISDSKYSGGKALELTESNASIAFSFTADKRAKYKIFVGYDGNYGQKVVNLSVNGNNGTFSVNGQAESEVGTYIMQAGANSILITPNWTWFRIDYIRLVPENSSLKFNISKSPVDPEATPAARLVYTFLYENFGKKTISGIMTGDLMGSNGSVIRQADVKAVYQAAGKYPALIGFDFMNATGSYENDSWNLGFTRECVNLAKDTYRRGGIPAFTWHWRDPSRNTNAFYTSDCNMKVSDAMNANGSWNKNSQLYKYIIHDIDKVADYLLELQKEDVAVVFRPLHEASGGWFWWGREGASSFIKLYRLIYDEMVRVKGVHNVIWVWNAGDNDQQWNPGVQYYDVVSADIYNPDFDYSSNYVSFDHLKTLTAGRKIIALSENGPIPDIDKEKEDEAMWSWWMPWYQTWNGNFVDKTSKAEWRKCMSHELVVTLDEMNDGWFSTYDVNLDGQVDISDIVAIINTIAGDTTFTQTANVNGDDNIDISDIVAVINYIASL